MAPSNAQAEKLNDILKKESPAVYSLLSSKGRAIFYPAEGILAQGDAAKGKDINATLGTAYEDDGSPMVLPSLARYISGELDKKSIFPYANSYGSAPLRTQWKKHLVKKNPSLEGTPISTPVVTCALTHGLSVTGSMFMDEGTDIIVADLFWGNYNLVFVNGCGANLKKFNFFKDKKFDLDSFKETVNHGEIGKKIILLNFPNNPSGYTPTIEDGEKITAVLKEAAEAGNQLLVILDDAYFGLYFDDDIYKESLFAKLAKLHENLLAVKIDGITKEEYAWGLRVGFVTYGIKNGSTELYDALEAKTAGTVRGSISNAPHLSQSLILKALEADSYESEKKQNETKIRDRFLKVKQVLEANPQYREFFEELPFNSGYFMCLELKKVNAQKVWQVLLDKYSVGVIYLANKNLLRIAFAAIPAAKIERLFESIYNACKDCM